MSGCVYTCEKAWLGSIALIFLCVSAGYSAHWSLAYPAILSIPIFSLYVALHVSP